MFPQTRYCNYKTQCGLTPGVHGAESSQGPRQSTIAAGILGKTSECLNLDPIKDKIEGLGIKTLDVDGHNLNDLISSFESIKKSKDLNCILARTIKGKGSSIMENKKNWHYWNPMNEKEIKKTREELA